VALVPARWRELIQNWSGPASEGAPPLDDSEISTDQERRAGYLRVLRLGWLVFGLTSLVALPLYPSEQFLGLVIAGITVPTFFLTRMLSRLGWARAAGYVFCASVDLLWPAIFIALGLRSGFPEVFSTQANVLMAMALGVLVAGSLIGARAAFVVALVNHAVIMTLRLTLAPGTPPRGSLAAFGWLVAIVAWLYERSLAGAFGRLRTIRQDLERMVQARTARLQETVDQLGETSARLEVANRSLEAFSYSVAHDLRNLVQTILASAAFLDRESIHWPPEAQADLRRVLDASRRMSALIGELLDLARSRHGALARETVRLDDLARDVMKDLETRNPGRAVAATIEPVPPCEASPTLMRQVLVNLLTNALKFTADREVARIWVGCSTRGSAVAYYVRDNGIGFRPDQAERLFTAFYRGPGAARFEGTGIGLAIVQSIIEHHGGQVWAEGTEGGGATFYFTVAAAAASAATKATGVA
jgi:signal transduction histidine kinase